MDKSTLHNLARMGAVARLEQLQAELAVIQAAFPELVGNRGRLIKQRKGSQTNAALNAEILALRKRNKLPIDEPLSNLERMYGQAVRRETGTRKRRKMSAAARARISKAQKARWAKLRASKAK